MLYHGLLYVMLTTADMIILVCMTFQESYTYSVA